MTTTNQEIVALDRNIFALPAGTQVWYVRTAEEVEAMRAADIALGRTMTDDGETILYSDVGSFLLEEDAVVTVLRRTKVAWPTWSRKPKGLTEGFGHFKTKGRYFDRTVLFSRPRNV